MFEKYNAVCRGGALTFTPTLVMLRKFQTLCGGAPDDLSREPNRYVTTIHVINSAIVTLSKLSKAATVYRGLVGGLLPKEFWEPNEMGFQGGVDFGFVST